MTFWWLILKGLGKKRHFQSQRDATAHIIGSHAEPRPRPNRVYVAEETFGGEQKFNSSFLLHGYILLSFFFTLSPGGCCRDEARKTGACVSYMFTDSRTFTGVHSHRLQFIVTQLHITIFFFFIPKNAQLRKCSLVHKFFTYIRNAEIGYSDCWSE